MKRLAQHRKNIQDFQVILDLLEIVYFQEIKNPLAIQDIQETNGFEEI